MPQLPDCALEMMAGLTDRARRLNKRIVFPEGTDPRVVAAAARLAREGMAQPILVGAPPPNPPDGVKFVNPETSSQLRKYADLYFERRRARGITRMEAETMARRPLYFAALMVAAGDADGTVGGAAHTTAETVRSVLHCIGPDPKMRLVSSAYIMALHNRSMGHNGLLAFADCSIVIDPSPVQLAEITIATAATVRTLLNVEPAVALLSFSTKGSGKHASVDRVREALRVIRERAPDLNVDGELQADAAVSSLVGPSKAPGSTVAGRANTLIFPNLAAGNIAYKLVERLCESAAIGPFLQGVAKPANDLSRGASAQDIFNTAVVTAVQSESARLARFTAA